jgi:hypothetical protein
MKVLKELKQQGYPGAVKLTTKELRDYFATQVSAQVSDPNTVRDLMRHTSLNTTSRYMRTVTDRMKEAIRNLGASPGGKSGGNSLRKQAQSSVLMKLAIEGLRARKARETNGGRSRTRTYDLAHVRRAL